MQHTQKLSHAVRCETCGNQYSIQIDRCPRCKSNQRTVAYAMNRDAIDMGEETSLALRNNPLPPLTLQPRQNWPVGRENGDRDKRR